MKLAELLIELRANSGSLQRDFDKAHRQAVAFANDMKSALAGIGIGIGLGELVRGVKEVIAYEDEIGRAARSTGMTAEQMSGLAYAAKQFEVPLHDVTMGLAYFDRVEGGLMRSKQGQTAMHLLGLRVRDLNGGLKNSHRMLTEVADKFAGLKDSTAKTAIATALFGQTYGLELIPLLDQGRKGIDKLEATAKRLGVTLSEKDVDAAVRAEASMHNLQSAMLGLGVVANRGLIPALTETMELLTGDANAAAMFADGAKELFLEITKGASYLSNPLFGGPIRKHIDKELDSIETDYILHRDALKNSLPDFASLFNKQNIKIPNIMGESAAKKKAELIADALRSLREELTGLSQGSVARGLAHFKDLGASAAQFEQAKALLTQIRAIKDKTRAEHELNAALKEESGIQKSLAMAVSGFTAPRKEYADTIARLNALAAKGVNITNALALAQERYRQELVATATFPSQAGGAPEGARTGNPFFFSPITPYNLSRLDQFDNKAKELGKTMQSSFVGMIVEGQNFGSVLKNLTTLFAEFLLKAVVFKELSTAFGTTGFGGLVGSFFGGLAGGKAAGGPVTAGSLYMVGESGPELFAPGMSGTIIPNAGAASVRGGATVNIDARGADAGVEHRIMRAMDAMRKQTIGASLVANYEYQARGGTL